MSKASRARRAGQTGKSQTSLKTDQKAQTGRLDAYLSGAILALGCFILFLPLVVNYDFYFPYMFLKSILFRLAAEVMILIYAVLAVRFPIYRPRVNLLAGSLLAYFCAMLVSSLPGVSVSPWNSWWGNFERMGGMFTQLHLLAYFFVLFHVVKRERDWLLLFTASLFSGVLMGFSGLTQLLDLHFLYRLGPVARVEGAAGNATFFPAHLLLNFFIALWFLSLRDKKTAYESAARYWLILLGALDFFLVAWEAAAGGAGPITSGLAHPPVVIFAAALHAGVVSWFIMRRRIWVGTLFMAVLEGYLFFWIYRSGTRGAMTGMIVSLTMLLVALAMRGAGKLRRPIALVLLVIIVCVPVAVYLNRHSTWVMNHPVLSRLTLLSANEIVRARYWPWKASVLAMLDRPILGWGLENYSIGFDRHYPPQIFDPYDPQLWFDHAHNLFLDAGATTGFLGLSLYLIFYALVFTFLVREWVRTRDLANSLVIASLLLAYLIQGLATLDTVNTDVLIYLLLAYVAWYYQQARAGTAELPAARPDPITGRGTLVLGTAAAVLVSSFWFLVKGPYESNLLLNRAVGLTKATDPKTRTNRVIYVPGTIDLFQAANDYQTTGRYQVREELTNYASEVARTPDLSRDVKLFVARQAIALQQESTRQDPRNARHRMYFASLVNRCFPLLAQADPAMARSISELGVRLLHEAIPLSPTRPQLYFEMAQTLGRLGRIEAQASALETGLALNRSVEGIVGISDDFVKRPNLNLLFAYILLGRYDAAARQLEKIRSISVSLTPEDNKNIAALYAQKGQYQQALRLTLEEVQRTPDDPQLLARLAATYRDMGEAELARQAAIKAASLSPQLESELKPFLKSLEKNSK